MYSMNLFSFSSRSISKALKGRWFGVCSIWSTWCSFNLLFIERISYFVSLQKSAEKSFARKTSWKSQLMCNHWIFYLIDLAKSFFNGNFPNFDRFAKDVNVSPNLCDVNFRPTTLSHALSSAEALRGNSANFHLGKVFLINRSVLQVENDACSRLRRFQELLLGWF